MPERSVFTRCQSRVGHFPPGPNPVLFFSIDGGRKGRCESGAFRRRPRSIRRFLRLSTGHPDGVWRFEAIVGSGDGKRRAARGRIFIPTASIRPTDEERPEPAFYRVFTFVYNADEKVASAREKYGRPNI